LCGRGLWEIRLREMLGWRQEQRKKSKSGKREKGEKNFKSKQKNGSTRHRGKEMGCEARVKKEKKKGIEINKNPPSGAERVPNKK